MKPLISVAELRARLAAPDLRLIDCRFDLAEPTAGREAWSQGHIPGAIYAHLDEDLSGPADPSRGRHPLPEAAQFGQWLASRGIGREQHIVVYDQGAGAIAARAWWLLRWAGFLRVQLLDGGLAAWLAEGGILSRAVRSASPGLQSTLQRWPRGWTVEAAQLAAGLADRSLKLLDARPAVRFRGESETIDPVAGHVPGAINRPWEDNLGDDGRLLPLERLRAEFVELLGEVPPERTVHMCGSGVTACLNLLIMEAVGLQGSRLYAPSWSGWISEPKRPVATG